MREKNLQRKTLAGNDRGVTLVELLVAVAILAVVGGAIMSFLLTSINLYQKVSREANLQNEAQLTISQLENLVVNASNGVSIGTDRQGTSGTELYIYDHEDTTFEIIHIYQEDSKLMYCTIAYSKNADGETIQGADKQNPSLLSKYVTDFDVDMTKFSTENSIDITLGFENRGRTYSTTNTIYLRNTVAKTINGTADVYFSEDYDEQQGDGITALQFASDEVYVWPGQQLVQPFTVLGTKDDVTAVAHPVFDQTNPRVIWSVEDSEDVTINRTTGVITVAETASGDATIHATTVSSLTQRSGTISASATVHIKSYNGISLTIPKPVSENNHKYYECTLTVEGDWIQPESDMTGTPAVEAGSGLSATFTKDEENSSYGSLRWKVQIKRPSEYLNKTFTLRVSYTLNGIKKTCSLSGISFTPADIEKEKEVEKVRLVDGSSLYESGSGLVSQTVSRGETKSLTMQVHYAGDAADTWETLDPEDWSITPDDSSVKVSQSGTGYNLALSVEDYTKTVTVNCTTRYSGSSGASVEGPGVQYQFNPVTIALDNGVPTTQTKYPVTRGTTQHVTFSIKNLEGAKLYLLSRSDSTSASSMRVSMSGNTATITVGSDTNQKKTFYFGVKTSDGTKLPETIACSLTLVPGAANLYDTSLNAISGGVYIPIATANSISSFDSSKTTPVGSGTVVLYMLDGTPITYTANSSTSRYNMTYDGTTYKYGYPEHRISGWVRR